MRSKAPQGFQLNLSFTLLRAARSTLEKSAGYCLQITSGTAKVPMFYSDEFEKLYYRIILEKMEAGQAVSIAQKQ